MSRVSVRSEGPLGSTLRAVPGYQAIVDHLRREITLGRIMPGDRLPAERALAEQFGVARETLRQALRVLEGSGQIVIRRGAAGGAVVLAQESDPEKLLRELRERRDELFELIEFRRIIEPAAAGLAASRKAAGDLRDMDAAQEGLRASSTTDEARRADTAFHLAIAQAAGNPPLERAIEDARALMFTTTDLVSFEFGMESSFDGHARVLAAIRAADADAAVDAMRHHLDVTVDELHLLLKL